MGLFYFRANSQNYCYRIIRKIIAMAKEKNAHIDTPIPPQRQEPTKIPDKEKGIHQKPDPEKEESEKSNKS